MPWQDFREFFAELERRGDTRVVEGADADLEIGTLTELMCERKGPMLLFDHIKGYPPGSRIATKPYSTPARTALALGLPEQTTPFEMFKIWRERFRNYKSIKPVETSSSVWMENAQEGNAVDLTKFPAPRWHERDGGAYFGTGCTVITRDPDEQWVNLGTYRCMLHDNTTLGLSIGPYHHGNLQIKKLWARGKSCPIAVAVTVEPYLFSASTSDAAWGTPEYEWAGFVKGEPIEIVSGPRTGLPLPARAELIVEGEVPPTSEETRKEGPFGEFTGYYAGGEKMEPVIRVKSVYHRTHPILHGEPPLKPPVETLVCPPSGSSTLRVWEGLEKSGVPGVKGVFNLSMGGGLVTVVAISQQYSGHAQQVGRIASGLMHTICRLMVVVDDDIDPSNAEEVLWAIATRCDPETSLEVQRECPSSPLDPIIPPERKKQRDYRSSRILVVACRPWKWRDEFPMVNKGSEELRQSMYKKWHRLFS